jgi:hypothetical protein
MTFLGEYRGGAQREHGAPDAHEQNRTNHQK